MTFITVKFLVCQAYNSVLSKVDSCPQPFGYNAIYLSTLQHRYILLTIQKKHFHYSSGTICLMFQGHWFEQTEFYCFTVIFNYSPLRCMVPMYIGL